MAKLYFRHGAMGSSKTANALMVEYNYYERCKKALLLKPQVDLRDGERMIRSRSGLEKECSFVEEVILLSDEEIGKFDCVIVDEAQFCKKSDIEFFIHIVDDIGIPVICYGLRTDFKGNLFEGSSELFSKADEIDELYTICSCGKRAKFNGRFVNNAFMQFGEQVVIDEKSTVKYVPLCGTCFLKYKSTLKCKVKVQKKLPD